MGKVSTHSNVKSGWNRSRGKKSKVPSKRKLSRLGGQSVASTNSLHDNTMDASVTLKPGGGTDVHDVRPPQHRPHPALNALVRKASFRSATRSAIERNSIPGLSKHRSAGFAKHRSASYMGSIDASVRLSARIKRATSLRKLREDGVTGAQERWKATRRDPEIVTTIMKLKSAKRGPFSKSMSLPPSSPIELNDEISQRRHRRRGHAVSSPHLVATAASALARGKEMSTSSRTLVRIEEESTKIGNANDANDVATTSADVIENVSTENSPRDTVLRFVLDMLKTSSTEKPAVYITIKQRVMSKFGGEIFEQVKDQIQMMLYDFSRSRECKTLSFYKKVSSEVLVDKAIDEEKGGEEEDNAEIVVLSGKLFKKSRWIGQWKIRFFELNPGTNTLEFWKENPDDISTEIESGQIHFITEQSIPRTYLRNPNSDIPWAFATKLFHRKSKRYVTIHLAATSAKDHWAWVNALTKAAEQWADAGRNVEDEIGDSRSHFGLGSSGKSFFASLLGTNHDQDHDCGVRGGEDRNKGDGRDRTAAKIPEKRSCIPSSFEPKPLVHFGKDIVDIHHVRVKCDGRVERTPLVLRVLELLMNAPLPPDDESDRPALANGLLLSHLFREEPEESLKKHAVHFIDVACAASGNKDACKIVETLRSEYRDFADNRPLLASVVKSFFGRLPKKILSAVDSSFVASLPPDIKEIPTVVRKNVATVDDATRRTLVWLLRFLAKTAKLSNGMDPNAVAICLAPVLFEQIPIDMTNPMESIRLQKQFAAASSTILRLMIESGLDEPSP